MAALARCAPGEARARRPVGRRNHAHARAPAAPRITLVWPAAARLFCVPGTKGEGDLAKMRDVARRAGVSTMTVSRVLNDPTAVTPETRRRVLQAVQELGYVRNAVARSLARGRTDMIALIVSDIENPFFTTLSRGVEDRAQRYGYTLVVGNSDENAAKERKYLDVLYARRIDGVILSAVGDAHVELLQQHGIPVVLVDRLIPGAEVDTVIHDTYDGGRQIVAHLLEQGYRDIMFIGGHPRNSTMQQRLAGCRDALQVAGLSLSVRLGRLDVSSGQEIIASVLAEGALPQALIAANTPVAVGAMVELREHGQAVPQDVALACFGDLELGSQLDPFLTAVRQPAYDLGKVAMEMLHARLNGSTDRPRHEVLPVELIVRRSTRRI